MSFAESLGLFGVLILPTILDNRKGHTNIRNNESPVLHNPMERQGFFEPTTGVTHA